MTPTLALLSFFFFSFFFFFVVFGGPPRTREEAGPRFTCSIRLKKGLKRLMRKRKTERGGGFGSDKDGGRHNEQE